MSARADGGDDGTEDELVFRELLSPLYKLRKPGVTDIFVNRPEEVVVQTAKGWDVVSVPELTFARCIAIATAIMARGGVNVVSPGCMLPDGERAQAAVPPRVPAGTVAIAISVPEPRVSAFTHRDLVEMGIYKRARAISPECPRELESALSPADRRLLDLYHSGRFSEFIEEAVPERYTILASGATRTGKTTFINALLPLIPSHERLGIIEEQQANELHTEHKNQMTILFDPRDATGEMSAMRAVQVLLRFGPWRIIFGEILGRGVAYDFGTAALSDHPGSITSVHGRTAPGAFRVMVRRSRGHPDAMTLTSAELMAIFRESIEIVVQFKKEQGANGVIRYISEIYFEPWHKYRFSDDSGA